MKQWLLILVLISSNAFAQKNIWDENPNDSQLELDSLLVILPQSIKQERIPLLNRIAEIYWVINPDRTIEFATEALQLSLEFKNKKQEGYALINLCQGYLFNNIYDKALKLGLESLEVRKNIDDDYDLAFTLRTLGWLYYDIGYYNKALEYHVKTLKIHEKINDVQRIAYSYNSIGLTHAKKEDYYLALTFFKKSLALKKEFNKEGRIAETMKNIGICYYKLDELKLSKEFLEASLEISDKIKDNQIMVQVLNELSKVNLKLGNFNKSAQFLTKSRLIIMEFVENKEWILENDLGWSNYYYAMGDYKKALENYKKYEEARTDVFTNNESEKLTEMRILYEAERSETEIKYLEKQRNLEAQKKKYLIFGFVLLVIIGVLIIFFLRNNIKKKKAIYKQSTKLSKEKLKTQSLLRENLEHKLDFRMKELTNLALFISQRSSIYKDLVASFKRLNFSNSDQLKKDVNTLIKEYTFKFDFNEDIQKFHTNVETLQSDFLFKIKEKFPKLTEKEVQLAVQVKLKLSSKEIANLNNISLNSVEIGRHRLRKKLNLEKKDNLVKFLENI
ncbi:tetratricopeptide repeat protein [Polaribacter ponticola]|uniref:Tetratricopeptide repeat protein n=1 Tax=Polaribacter ponticola TaxID=2978475 RepID=A0ABT5S9Q2_9FLAO|nr:tetratricopeptide repeat protein [Polaribacter sp. MSW5]MDD7914846.1 tetratricopeptide repeat protein [Polaribacter sp. MSW5]